MVSAVAKGGPSTLELLLASLMEREEKPPDVPPPLPLRPLSKGRRLPSSGRIRQALAQSFHQTPATFDHAQLPPPHHSSVQKGYRDADESGDGVEIGVGDENGVESGVGDENGVESGVRDENGVESVVGDGDGAQNEDGDGGGVESGVRDGDESRIRVEYIDGVEHGVGIEDRVQDRDGDEDGAQNGVQNGNSAQGHEEFGLTEDGLLFPHDQNRKRKRNGLFVAQKNFRVWYADDEKWMLGFIESATDDEIAIRTTDCPPQSQPELEVSFSSQLLVKSPWELLPANPRILDGVEDIAELSYVNLPAIVYNLQVRYSKDESYTRAGPVLLGVDPYKSNVVDANIYSQLLRKKGVSKLSPHICMKADEAHKAMMRDRTNQTFIISGDCESGKAHAVNDAWHYLANLGTEDRDLRISHFGSVLEAFGNAKTLAHNNSRRYGMLIEVHFESSGISSGSSICTYLLEKSRVVERSARERSFHIFYQLCSGANAKLRAHLHLRAAEDYMYLNQSDCISVDDIDDAAEFCATCDAMCKMNMKREDQDKVFEVLAGILWLGNITFSIIDQENHVSVDDNEALSFASDLLKCPKQHLRLALCSGKFSVPKNGLVQKLTYEQALRYRDAVAKVLYGSLFDCLTSQLNNSSKAHTDGDHSISILSLSGFQCSQKNGLENLCINYVNEKLHQYSIHHLLKLQQEEYRFEGVDWMKVDSNDNGGCIDLLEKHPLGLFSLLDEACRSPDGTDSNFVSNMTDKLLQNNFLKMKSSLEFGIRHYAGEVLYCAKGFLEENRNLNADVMHFFSSCGFLAPTYNTPERDNTGFQNHTVVADLQMMASEMIKRVEITHPHFVICIKPNSLCLQGVFDQKLVLHQLQYHAIAETVRLLRSGYPLVLLHQQFSDRYKILLPQSLGIDQDALSICIAILHHLRVPCDMYQVGFTKLFLRTWQVKRLEELRECTLSGIIAMQKLYRGRKVFWDFKERRRLSILVQSWVRGMMTRQYYRQLRERHRAAIVIQKFFRGKLSRVVYRRNSEQLVIVQSVVRSWLARRQLMDLRIQLQSRTQEASSPTQFSFSDKHSNCVVDTAESKVMEANGLAEKDQSLTVTTLHSSLASAKAVLSQKEEEITSLMERLKQYETQLLEKDNNLRLTEEKWQKKVESLELIIATVTNKREPDPDKSISTESNAISTETEPIITEREPINTEGKYAKPERESTNRERKLIKTEREPVNTEPKPTDRERESIRMKRKLEEWSPGIHTTSASKSSNLSLYHTPERRRKPSEHLLEIQDPKHPLGMESGGLSAVTNLSKELDYRTDAFNDNANHLLEPKSGKSEVDSNQLEELRILKIRFEAWKKDYKARLRETKMALNKLRNESKHKLRWRFWNNK